jgi:hypothetical protein
VAFSWDFDVTNQIVRFRLIGRITDAELMDLYKKMGEITTEVRPRAAVTDLSDVTSFEVSRQTISNLAKQDPAFSNPERPRILIAPSPFLFGVTRMFQMEGESTRPNLFVVHTHEAAWAILGVKEPVFTPYKDGKPR